MALVIGSRLGPYEILSALGIGGMGEVYRAKDSKLGRDVAIKVLPEQFVADPERVARFRREAQILAALNHPNIAAIFGLEDADGRQALVMELVDGPTLAHRIAQGPIPLDEVLQIARQTADALEAAHEKGIVHRDLKPANIAFTADHNLKVLDFGLAKAVEAAPSTSDLTRSPTLSMMATQAGLILGTAAYMSPEQAKGLPADHRSDVFSFGVVLYEMLTGRQAFRGETAPDILASVLVRDADLSELPPNLNPRLPELIRRCLDKNLRRRMQAMGDVRGELELIAAAPTTVSSDTRVPPPTPLWKIGVAMLTTALVVGWLAAYGAWKLKPSPPPVSITKFALSLPKGQEFTNPGRRYITISRDGTRIAYIANRELFVRSLSDFESAPIRGTKAATGLTNPVFSPDGKFVAYWAEGAIKKVAVAGGTPTTLCVATLNPLGMSWEDGGLLFSQGGGGIMRIAAGGGQPEPLVEMKSGVAHDPQFLLNDKSVLFTLAADNNADKSRVVVQSIPSGELRVLVEDANSPRYLESGHLVFVRGGVLFAAPFDAHRLAVTAEPVPVVEGVRRGGRNAAGAGQFAVSSTGSLVYVPGPGMVESNRRDLLTLDLKGATRVLGVTPAAYNFPRVSPDGRWLAVDADDGADASIYLYNLSGEAQIRRLTLAGRNRFPIWYSDSTRVTFQSDVEGDASLFWQRIDGVGRAERLTRAERGVSHVPEAWTPDGKTLLFAAVHDGVFTLQSYSKADGRVMLFADVRSIYPPGSALSPDGRWLAYYLRPPGSPSGSLIVQPFPSGAKQEIMKAGGLHPIWIPGSQPAKLLYQLPTGYYTVEITTQPVFGFSKPAELPFRRAVNGQPSEPRNMDVTPDGQRVVAVARDTSVDNRSDSNPDDVINVVLNWLEELRQRVPTR